MVYNVVGSSLIGVIHELLFHKHTTQHASPGDDQQEHGNGHSGAGASFHLQLVIKMLAVDGLHTNTHSNPSDL